MDHPLIRCEVNLERLRLACGERTDVSSTCAVDQPGEGVERLGEAECLDSLAVGNVRSDQEVTQFLCTRIGRQHSSSPRRCQSGVQVPDRILLPSAAGDADGTLHVGQMRVGLHASQVESLVV